MSQGTPTRESRIERHLMRQRGAGVRTITADFGFSFELPASAPVFPVPTTIGPPTKRRKTNEILSPRCSNPTLKRVKDVDAPTQTVEKPFPKHITENIPEHQDNLPAQTNLPGTLVTVVNIPPSDQPITAPKRPKQPSKARRKLRLEDELDTLPQRHDSAPQPGGLEDTFIFGLKPKKRQPTRKAEQTIKEVLEGTTDVPVPPTRKRTAKPKQETSEESVHRATAALDPEIAAPEKEPKVIRGKRVSKKRPKALPVEKNLLEDMPDIVEAPLAAVDLAKTPLARLETSANVTKTLKSKPAATKATKRKIDIVAADVQDEATVASGPVAKRPRRQAAICATEKVALGYEEGLIPTDKLRRVAEPATKPKRQRKSTTLKDVPVLPPSPPRSTPMLAAEERHVCDTDEKPPVEARPAARGRERGRKAAAKTNTIDVLANEKEPIIAIQRDTGKPAPPQGSSSLVTKEHPIPQAPPAKRARKACADEAKLNDAATSNESVVADVNSQERVSAKTETRKTGERNSPASKAPPVKRGRKVTRKTDKSVDALADKHLVVTRTSEQPDIVIAETQDAHDVVAAKPGRTTKARRALAESDVNIVRCLPLDEAGTAIKTARPSTTRPGLFDEAMTKPASKAKGTQRTRATQRTKPPGDTMDGDPTVEHEGTKRPVQARPGLKGGLKSDAGTTSGFEYLQGTTSTRKEPPALLDELRPEPEPTTEPVPTKCARKAQPAQQVNAVPHVESTFDKPVVPKKRHVIAADEDLDWLFEKPETRRSRPAAARQTSSMPSRKQATQSAKDMDLDDLLESIAGFSGKLLTGKRGRAVAS